MRRILVLATNLSQASFRVRIAAMQPLLLERGFYLDVYVRPKGWRASTILKATLRTASDYHAVIIQRKFLSPGEATLLRRHAKRILYDIDDAMMHHNRDVGLISRWRTARNYAATTRILDHVVAGNEYLAGIFREQGRTVTVIPTMLDSRRYFVKTHAATNAPKLVWIGSRSTIGYLEQCVPAIEAAALQLPGLRLLTIANATVRSSKLQVEHVEWTEAGEAAALCQGDIGLAPTPSDPWTMGKCGFKILQYMASGLPVIASPVGANADIVPPGVTGLLPKDLNDWPAAIITLARDMNLRARMGRAARELAETRYTLERAADGWAEILGASCSPVTIRRA
jgi:glycosyltransferase involved in cell wall biosynthesis